MIDLRDAVLAENLADAGQKFSFDFLCPNCGQRHWAEEIITERPTVMAWVLECGPVKVRMPWASTPARDEKDVYGNLFSK